MKSINESYEIVYFKDLGDERGNLIVVEELTDIPFEIKRVFYIYGSDKKVIRGQHANLETEFMMINVSGKSKVKICNGKESVVVELDQPHMGLYLKKMTWKEMYDFSTDSVLLVLASEHYNSQEYIRDYNEYKKIMRVEK